MSHSHHSRSRSVPSELHPIATSIELELKTLQPRPPTTSSSPTSAQAVCSALAGLHRLHRCAGELLRSPLAQQAFARRRRPEKWVAEELDASIRLLDLSGTARDLLSSTKEQVRDLESAVRMTRRGSDRRGVEKAIAAYLQLRRRSQRDVGRCLAALKSLDPAVSSGSPPAATSLEQNSDELSILVRLLSEVRAATVTVMCSVLSLMATPKPQARPSINKRSLVSRVMGSRRGRSEEQGRKVVASEEQGWESADALLSASTLLHGRVSGEVAGGEEMVRVQKLMETMEAGIEGVAAGLECLFRQLIQNRVSLLNVLSP